MSDDAFVTGLRAEVGKTGTPQTARDPVNEPMIRHWCDAMDDANPLYTDRQAAAAGPHEGIVAPPAMLDVWPMPGNIPRVPDPNDPTTEVYRMLDEAGFHGVVATNSEHVYNRYLRPGEVITTTQKLLDVSDEKHTGLGIGHFVTTEYEFHNQDGEHVASKFWRLLKFRPGTGRTAPAQEPGDAPAERPQRPRPSRNQDTDFFWDGAREGELRIQRCIGCGELQHPPGVRCPACGSSEVGVATMSGRGHLYSYAVVHHPQVPSFDYPLPVGLVELEEGVRVVSNVTDCTREQITIGMPLEFYAKDFGDGLVLPQFRPARQPRRESTRPAAEASVGDELPLCPVPITPTLIVAGAMATRDYQRVHHDRDDAVKNGSKDIFTNILTSMGLSQRYISDWVGPEASFKSLKVRLGAPNYPYDCMTFSGSVTRKDPDGTIEITFKGLNSLGPHVTGTSEVVLP